MRKIKNITITPLSEQPGYFEVTFPMGYFFTVSEADLLNPAPQTQVFANLRTAYRVGNYGEVQSKEFLNGINSVGGQNGFETKDGKVFVSSIEDGDYPGMLLIGMSSRKGEVAFDIQIHKAELTEEPDEMTRCQAVLANIGTFLKLRGDKTITTAAINAVKQQQFWW